MPRIFISYRRDDSAGYVGRLHDRLSTHFGTDAIFMDIDTIEPGEDFVTRIEEAVSSCDVLLAVIGKQWLTITDANNQRRLDNPEDFVRLEITAALRRNIKVIPVLVSRASMPSADLLPDSLQALARRNAHEISDSRFDYDVRILTQSLEKMLGSQPLRRWALWGAILLVAGVLAIVAAVVDLEGRTSSMTPAPATSSSLPQGVQTVRIDDPRAAGPSRGFFTSTGHIVAYVIPGSTVVSVSWSSDGQTWEGEAHVEDRGDGYIPEDIVLLSLIDLNVPQILLPIRLSTSLQQGDFIERYVSAQDRAPGTVLDVNVQKQVHMSSTTSTTISRALVTTAVSAPTDAGAPLLDEEGRVVGLVFGASASETVAVPIDMIKAEFFVAFP